MSNVLSGAKSRLPAEAQADQRLAEVQELCTALQSVPGTVHTSKGQTVADTVQIDLYDGKLYVWMRDLNQAARRAIRNGYLNARLQDYAFHHLKRSGNPAPPAPTPQTSQHPRLYRRVHPRLHRSPRKAPARSAKNASDSRAQATAPCTY